MKRNEFLNLLNRELQGCEEGFRNEILDDFQEHFNEAQRQGYTDEEVIASFGDLNGLFQELKEGNIKSSKYEVVPVRMEEKTENRIKHLVIYGLFADIEVRRSTNGSLYYECAWDAPMETDQYAVEETIDHDTFTIQVHEKSSHLLSWLSSVRNLQLNVYVPDTLLYIDVHNSSGNLSMQGISNIQIGFEAASGDIALNHLTGDIEIHTASGDVKIQDCHGSALNIETTSGDMEIEGTFDQESLTATSGDIENCVSGNRLDITTTSGDLTLKGRFEEMYVKTSSGDVACWELQNHCEFMTGSGDLELALADFAGVTITTGSGDVELDTGSRGFTGHFLTSSGDIDLDVSESYRRVERNTYIYRDGECMIDIRTGSGDITIAD